MRNVLAEQSQLPDVSQAPSPGVAYALIIGSVLIAAIPALFAYLRERRASSKPAGDTPPALPTAVERGTDLAERYFDSLEARAERAEKLLEETRSQMFAAERRHAAESLEFQRQLDAAQQEIRHLRQQVDRLTWRGN